MIQKIIDMLAGAVIFASAIAAVPMALCNLGGPTFVAWILAVMLSGLWQLFRYQTDDGPLLKMPRPSGNSNQGQRKFYNISLADGTVKVNGKNL